MDLDDFIITAFCIIDDTMNDILRHRRLRQRGPKPSLSDSEVLTIEVVGEYLRLHQDKAIFDYFCRHYSHFFPALKTLHRTTFVRQAANLCAVKELVWQGVLAQISLDSEFHIIDSIPLPACRFARAYRCQRFKGDAAFGYDSLGSADILRIPSARAGGVARRHRGLQRGACQHPRHSHRSRTHIRPLGHGLGRQKLLESQTDRGTCHSED